MAFLPVTREEMERLGWDAPDFVLVTGDAYVDHPSFGHAIISRLLESRGYRVAILAQPDWRSIEDFQRFGRPRLGFLVNSGNVDSMVNHYSVFRHRRKTDQYSPGGKSGRRPDRAVIVYCNKIREAYGSRVPVIIGGIEASLRRLGHYDYWDDRVRNSILLDSQADLLIYGMGEHPVAEIAEALRSGIEVKDITWIRGTVYKETNPDFEKENSWDEELELLPSFADICRSKELYAQSFLIQYRNTDSVSAKRLAEYYGKNIYVVQNPPAEPLTRVELDDVYELPYQRACHPSYEEEGGVPALREVKFSLTSVRGCFGGCAFCTISAHQGKFIVSRSKASILKEVKEVMQLPDFKGYLSDLGGPSANMYQMKGKDEAICKKCKRPSCIHPKVCPNLNSDHRPLLDIYHAVDALPGIKKSFIGSGVRYDLLLHQSKDTATNRSTAEYTRELIASHVSGRLKVAPEHTSDRVLSIMRKPSFEQFETFKKIFDRINREENLRQQLIPYFISSHPGCKEEDMAELAVITKRLDFHLEQVQDFTPTPMTVATETWYTGFHPYTLEPIFSAKTQREKLAQRQFFFWYKPEERKNIINELRRIGRQDLIDKLYGKKK